MFYRPVFLPSGIRKKLPVAGSYCFRKLSLDIILKLSYCIN